MSVFSFLNRLKQKMIKQMVSREMRVPYAKSMNLDDKTLTIEGFSKNVIVFSCIDIISSALATVPFDILVDGEVVNDHPLKELLERPNNLNSGSCLRQYMTAYRLITGHSYLERVGPSENEPPRELWLWMPYNIDVIASKHDKMPLGYIYSTHKTDTQDRIWPIDTLTGISELMQWKTFNPFNQYKGMSPIQAAAIDVDQHNAAARYNYNLLKNSARPDGILSADRDLTEPQFNKLIEMVNSQMSGISNAGRALVLDNGLRWTQMGLSPKDISWLESQNLSSKNIAAVYGVPVQLIGVTDSQTFSNYGQARLALWEDTVIPLAQDLANELTSFLSHLYPDRPRVKANFESIPALEEKRSAKWTTLKDADWLTINEKRREIGYAPVEDESADQIWVSSTKIPINITTGDDTVEEVEEEVEEDEKNKTNIKEVCNNLKSNFSKIYDSNKS